MSANRTKLIAAMSLSILLCIFGCIGLVQIAKKGSEGQAPIRALRITIDESERIELFAQLLEFSIEHDFRFLLRTAGPENDGFFIEMIRDDLEISASITRSDPKTVSVGFYDREPSNPTPKETVDELVNDLQRFLSEIPDITITED
jgi:hypothetical protein